MLAIVTYKAHDAKAGERADQFSKVKYGFSSMMFGKNTAIKEIIIAQRGLTGPGYHSLLKRASASTM